MLLDTASLYYRAFYGVPDTLTAPDGTPVNAVRGLLDMISRLVRGRSPAGLIACMDADWRPAFRVAAVPSYKAHRARADGSEEAPPALTAQIPVIEQVLGALGLAMAAASGYEADDVIGTLATRAGGPVEIVTGDRDLFQLVDDERPVRVIYTVRGLSKLDVVDEAAVTERYGIPGRAYADFAVLRRERAATDAATVRWAGSLDAAWLAAPLRYRAMVDDCEYEHPLWWAVSHFFNHQTHHRGHAHACCSMLTGTEPPSLDLLAFQRGVPAPDLAS